MALTPQMTDQERCPDQQDDAQPRNIEAEGVMRDGNVKCAPLQESPKCIHAVLSAVLPAISRRDSQSGRSDEPLSSLSNTAKFGIGIF
jgi:hypothetical protein